jgi:hypothetical protein
MSGAGQSCRFDRRQITSGLPPEAAIFGVGRHVSNVPKPEVKRSLFQHRGLARIALHPSISIVTGNKDVFARLTWPEVAPSLLPGLLFGARFRILGYLYAGEEIEIARRT